MVLGQKPLWFSHFFPHTEVTITSVHLKETFPFLSNFLSDTQHHWDNQQSNRLDSGLWVELDLQGEEIPLGATALFLDTLQLLLINAAGQALRQIYRKGPRYAKAGVMRLDISLVNTMQGHLFQERDSERAIALMKTVDQLNRLYGRRAVFFASEGCTQAWAMKRQRCTPSYTTRWEDLPVVQ
ncbi:hypothetical protein C1752_15926 [Acaryochloris thomasi RCC1774]|uniref:DUF4113 domain-containing protein n=1 Tax=Acaryochloris thomasi RCC1774 TaxID=1764569 RepID=A0A2W1JIZ1_9CYAN|nr:DUF4113 domain-containing protein [Acaryochloris thomasi]PZD70234.1 hypothetical protein C1752_15926 [Acaryochloris thomasi RCC1774]